jgi:hypothetical protein
MAALDVVCHPDRLPRSAGVSHRPIGDAIAVPVEAPWLGEQVVCLAGSDGLALIDVETGRRWVVPRADVRDVWRDGRKVSIRRARVADGERSFVCADLARARAIAESLAGAPEPPDLFVIPVRVVRKLVAWLNGVAKSI